VAAGPGVVAPRPDPGSPSPTPAPTAAGLDRAGAATLRLPEGGGPALETIQREPGWRKATPEFRIKPVEKGGGYDLYFPAQEAPSSEAYQIVKEVTKVGRFEVRAVLGRGSFGQVYRAFDPLLGREVALKVLKRALGDPDALQQRQREARAVARLRHQNIVAVFEDGLNDGDYFIVSELIKGQPLSTLIAEAVIAPRRAVIWVRELARALAYAHLEGLVHRDVKPANILIDDRDRTQIIDFGLAYHVGEATRTASRTPVGTPAYMAPEQAGDDAKAVGPLSDQYSLGVVLYELLTRRRPFEGEPQAILNQLQRDDPPPPRKLNPKIHPDLDAICLKAMARRPADRYPDLAKLASDLGQWLPVSPSPLDPGA
jgi:serine/threonine protein kinase